MIFLEPEFYDIFGIAFFIFLIIISTRALSGKKLNNLVFKILLVIGILGFIVDSFFVLRRFLF